MSRVIISTRLDTQVLSGTESRDPKTTSKCVHKKSKDLEAYMAESPSNIFCSVAIVVIVETKNHIISR